MFKHILVATDGSALSAGAVRNAAGLARASGARLTALNVTPCFQPVYPDWSVGFAAVPTEEDFLRETGMVSAEVLDRAAAIARGEGQACETLSVQSDWPWKAILAVARDRHCDAIVMASHGRRGLDALVLGSETQKVLNQGAVPVLVTR